MKSTFKLLCVLWLFIVNNSQSAVVPTITKVNVTPSSAKAGTIFKFTATLTKPLDIGNRVKVDVGNKILTVMTGNDINYMLSQAIYTTGKQIYRVGIYNSKGILQGSISSNSYIVTSTFHRNHAPALTLVSSNVSATTYTSYRVILNAKDVDENLSSITMNWGDNTPPDTQVAIDNKDLIFSHTYATTGSFTWNAFATDSDIPTLKSKKISKTIVVTGLVTNKGIYEIYLSGLAKAAGFSDPPSNLILTGTTLTANFATGSKALVPPPTLSQALDQIYNLGDMEIFPQGIYMATGKSFFDDYATYIDNLTQQEIKTVPTPTLAIQLAKQTVDSVRTAKLGSSVTSPEVMSVSVASGTLIVPTYNPSSLDAFSSWVDSTIQQHGNTGQSPINVTFTSSSGFRFTIGYDSIMQVNLTPGPWYNSSLMYNYKNSNGFVRPTALLVAMYPTIRLTMDAASYSTAQSTYKSSNGFSIDGFWCCPDTNTQTNAIWDASSNSVTISNQSTTPVIVGMLVTPL